MARPASLPPQITRERLERYREAIRLLDAGDGEAASALEALRWQGYPPALFTLGWCHLHGVAVDRSSKAAARLLWQAREKGHLGAALLLATFTYREATILGRIQLMPPMIALLANLILRIARNSQDVRVLGVEDYINHRRTRDPHFAKHWVARRSR